MYELLIVDDESFVVENLANTYDWEQLGIETVHTAFSASEALELLEIHNIPIVISDIRMPEMDGLEMIDRIKSISPKTKCVLLSGYSDFKYAQQAITSHAEAYLLKPVKEDELLSTVRSVIAKIELEWNEIVSQQRTLYTLNEHLPLLRGALLNDLLQGKYIPLPTLSKKLDMLNLQIGLDQLFAMMFIRLEQGFDRYDDYSLSLLEYGIVNISEEIFGKQFELWPCKDVNDNLVFVITNKIRAGEMSNDEDKLTIKILEKCSLQLQESVTAYLQGGISVLISEWGKFPEDLYSFYQKSMSVIRNHPDNVQGFFINSIQTGSKEEVQPLRSIHEPPLLWNLLEAGRWEAADRKFDRIVEELRGKKGYLHDYIYEVAMMVSFSVSHTIHKQGGLLQHMTELNLVTGVEHEALRSVTGLEKWGRNTIQVLKNRTINEAKNSQRSIIQKINQYVQMNLEHDVSLQSIAEHVYLHPVYVSKIYKLEAGEGISEYIYRLRMEKAAHLLAETNEKINEISRKSGYQNPSHFSRVFKKYFAMTPDEFREQHID
ncbi:response regulator transcription factor [Paenibacillus piri]|nr:response regulator [Paenibacillus piri]